MPNAIFEIFRIGKHNGTGALARMQWTDDHLAQMQQFYSDKVKSAPLVIGHPADDQPRLGEVKRLIHQKGALFAEADVTPNLLQKIKSGAFSGISAAFFPPDHKLNPIQSLGFYLKHVGFLEKGKQTPAVKGMLDPTKSIEFLAYAENVPIIYFCDDSDSPESLHRKNLYFQNVLAVDYETAFNLSTR